MNFFLFCVYTHGQDSNTEGGDDRVSGSGSGKTEDGDDGVSGVCQ